MLHLPLGVLDCNCDRGKFLLHFALPFCMLFTLSANFCLSASDFSTSFWSAPISTFCGGAWSCCRRNRPFSCGMRSAPGTSMSSSSSFSSRSVAVKSKISPAKSEASICSLSSSGTAASSPTSAKLLFVLSFSFSMFVSCCLFCFLASLSQHSLSARPSKIRPSSKLSGLPPLALLRVFCQLLGSEVILRGIYQQK